MIQEDSARISADVEEILRRQDEALALLSRLRRAEPFLRPRTGTPGGGRRDFRRWPTPPDVKIEQYVEGVWSSLSCLDIGIGGTRAQESLEGPVPLRLRTGESSAVIVLADVMWRGDHEIGLRFEFQDDDERDYWAGVLIDALLSAQALK